MNGSTAPGASDGATTELLKSGSIYTAALAFQLAAGVLVVPAVTRLLGADEYGVVVAAMVALQILSLLAAAGIPSAITRFHFAEAGPDSARRLITLTGLVSLAFVVVADVTGPLWSGVFVALDYGWTLRIATWSVLPLALVQAQLAALRAQKRPGAFAAVAIATSALGQVSGLVALGVFAAGPTGYIGGLALGAVFGALIGVPLVVPLPVSADQKRIIRAALVYGLPTIPHSIALFLMASGDRIVIERLLGLEDVGRYQVAYLVGSVGIAIAVAFNNAWAPQIYGSPEGQRWRILAGTSDAVHLYAAMIAGLLATIAPFALSVAAPDGYGLADLVPVVSIVAASLLPFVSYLSAAHVVFHLGRTGVVAWISPAAALLNVGLNYALVPSFGIPGAAVATVVSYATLAAALHAAAHRLAQVPWPRMRIARSFSLGLAFVVLGASLPTDATAWPRILVASALITASVVLFRRRR